MKIVVGLGNPGPKYEATRHNAGFLAVDRLIERWRATGPQGKYQAEIWKAKVGGEDVLLMKPETFMNLTGKSVAPAFNFFQCTPEDLIVIHDELDLKPMQLRLKTGGGPGGHNGIKSIDASLGAGKTGYHRVRVGIGHPASALVNQARIDPGDWVLMQFTTEECERLDKVLDEVADAVEMIIGGQMTAAMNKFNRS